jgi:hypothetical protein
MPLLLLNYFLINLKKILQKNPFFTTQKQLSFFMTDTVSVFVPNSSYGLRFLPRFASVPMTDLRNLLVLNNNTIRAESAKYYSPKATPWVKRCGVPILRPAR